ncbi:hypothetical protein B7R22_10525 [Subtercola boreus]|uniref:Histidinol dehydrogenase n=1 Tax=Subtercola boreus TaxID=120213 RepID=A0A3E0VW06_9MICO|nr:hypothetical protein [Subtercola boreus]RFA14046.1 hypothetical protein B7R22_10525 [Subtercola boreus]
MSFRETTVAETADQPVGESMVVRVASWIIGLLLGVVFGMLGTVVHQSTISFFGLFDLPLGLILAVASVVFLLVGLRLILPSRLIAFLAALGLVGIVAVLTLPSPGGSILIPADERGYGYVWTFAPTVIALVVLAWPKRRQAEQPSDAA